jgi:hypothetical protein
MFKQKDILSNNDKKMMNNVMIDLEKQYNTQLQAALEKLSLAERNRNRAAHEVARLRHHHQQVLKASKKHNIHLKGASS